MSFEQLDEDDRGYIAGFLDGEGCFSVGKRWKVTVACENTYRPTIERLHRVFGGCFTPMVRKKKKIGDQRIAGPLSVTMLFESVNQSRCTSKKNRNGLLC